MMNTEKSKQYFWLLLDIALAAFILNLIFFVMPTVKKLGDSFYAARTLNISAEGKTTVSPDIAETSFSVVSRGQDPKRIAESNNKKVTVAIEFVKSQGVDAKDIKTTGYNLSPDYKYIEETQESVITGYTLTQTVRVKIRDLPKAAEIIGGLPPLGVNQIGGISFTVDEPEKFLKEAREDAFRKAKAKAEEIARESGVKLGRIVNVGEFMSGPPVPYFYGKEGIGGGGDIAAVVPRIEPGTEELRVQVSLTYAIY